MMATVSPTSDNTLRMGRVIRLRIANFSTGKGSRGETGNVRKPLRSAVHRHVNGESLA
jgi:hypothetical protein